MPAKVRGAIRPFLNACFHTTLRSLSPLALASFMNSESNISSTDVLTSLRFAAANSQPIVMVGRIKFFIAKPSPFVALGSQFKFAAKIKINSLMF